MRKEIIETGKTVDAAIDSACEKLGCPRDDCEWEILDLPKKGLFGIKKIPARVRVAVEVPDEKPARQARPLKQQRQPEPDRTAYKTETKAEPGAGQKSEPKAEPRTEPKAEIKAELKEKPERRPRQEAAKERQAPRQKYEQPEQERPEPVNPNELSEKEVLARDYIDAIIGAMGLAAEYAVTHEHGGTCINITGKGLGVIIGRRGETLDAIQYLAGLAANRGDGDYLRLTVDCGDYRFKRKDTLEGLAKKLAGQVLKTNVSKTLEPMNPFERRIIHATVSEIEGVSSSSIGEEPNRRVVITSPTARPAPRSSYRDRGDRDRRDDYGGRGGRGPRRDPRPAQDNMRPAQESGENQERTAEGERMSPRDGERTFSRDGGDRGGYRGNRDNRDSRDSRGGRDNRDSRGDRDRRGGRGPRPASPVPQGPPKQTPESETTQGLKFGKIDL